MGADKARALARPLLDELRAVVGLRSFAASPAPTRVTSAPTNPSTLMPKPPTMRQYRDDAGAFYFKLVAKDGRTLVLGGPFASGAEAGQGIQVLRKTTGNIAGLPGICTGDGIADAEVRDGLRAWFESVVE